MLLFFANRELELFSLSLDAFSSPLSQYFSPCCSPTLYFLSTQTNTTMLSPKRARAPLEPETPPMSPGPSTSQPAAATFADLPNDCIIDILSFAGAPSSSSSSASCSSSSTSGDFRDLGRALCAAPWLRELGAHAWAATVRRRWPRWAAIADAAREKRAIAEEPRCSKSEEIAWRRQAELFELREREELAIAPLLGGTIAKKQTVVQPRHRAVLAEWLAEVSIS